MWPSEMIDEFVEFTIDKVVPTILPAMESLSKVVEQLVSRRIITGKEFADIILGE